MRMTRGAVLLGKKANFRNFLASQMGRVIPDEVSAGAAVREFCQVSSRSELDSIPAAGERYRELVRRFNCWMNTKS